MRFLIIIAIFGISGCSSGINQLLKQSKADPPSVITDGSWIKVSGDAKIPAAVDTKKSDVRLPIPEGSRFDFNDKTGQLSLTLSRAVEMAVNRTEMAVKGPVAFDPPKAPTAQEIVKAESDGKLKLWYGLGMAAGAAAALFGLVRGWNWLMCGGSAVLCGCGFGLFYQNHPVLSYVIGAGVAAAIIGPTIYHTKIKQLERKSQ